MKLSINWVKAEGEVSNKTISKGADVKETAILKYFQLKVLKINWITM